MFIRNIFTAVLLISITSVYSQLRINEIMSSNTTTITDEDNDDEDWIEIQNTGTSSINLTGYTLSDSNNVWEFPPIELKGGEYLLVFASGKNRKKLPLNWQTIIDLEDEWKYTAGYVNTSSSWKDPDFDDGSWSVGPSGFGYGDGDDNTLVSNVMAVLLRKTFDITDLSQTEQLILHMDYDDAFVAYINGIEIARGNITSEGAPALNQPADNPDHEAQMYQGLPPESFLISNLEEVLQQGSNTIAIQVHNHSSTSSDLSAIPFLTTGSTTGENALSTHLSISAPLLHTNFKLNADGETLLLYGPNSTLIDSVTFESIATDISYGRDVQNPDHWVYFNAPTPGYENADEGYNSQSGEVSFSKAGGNYLSRQNITLSSSSPDDQIYYTIDGSLPYKSGTLYSGSSISLTESTTIRAQVVNDDALPGPVATQTYLIRAEHDLPIVVVTTDPENLWDREEGIYAMGPNAEPNWPHFGANFWQDWEKPAHFELIETSGETVLSQNVGIKIFGGWTRGNAQKSLAVHARGSYGDNTLSYKIFETLEDDEFSSIVLRNSGNDWNRSMFRDALMTTLFDPRVDRQAYRPAVLYLNGEYWGIQNIREKVNEDFLARHHNLDPDSITILELNGQVVEGDNKAYQELFTFIEDNDLSIDENYEYVASQIDILNLISYQLGNIYVDNKDWPGNNIKYWRSQQPEGKWRWIAYDTDFGFSVYNESPAYNTLNFALNPNSPERANPPWATLFLRKLMDNAHFKTLFINAFCDQMNTTWLPTNVISKIDRMSSVIEPEISNHMNRWNGNTSNWRSQVFTLERYAQERPAHVLNHFSTRFNLGAQQTISIQAESTEGHVRLNTISLENYPWSGQYFEGVEIELEAMPRPGYRFVRWEGSVSSEEPKITVNPEANISIEAIFEELDGDISGVVINEINHSSSEDFDTGDWIELYNKSDEGINLSGWQLKDDDDTHVFEFTETTINPKEYLIVCRDKSSFDELHTGLNSLGDMDFGLAGSGDCVRLFHSSGQAVDQVCFEGDSPWPKAEPGKTLGLIDPTSDNSQANNWQLLDTHGTPGAVNMISDVLGVPSTTDTWIFPNPVIGSSINIHLKNSDDAKISLMTPDGRIYGLTGSQLQNRVVLNLPDSLTTGLYFIRIEQANETFLKKLMIHR